MSYPLFFFGLLAVLLSGTSVWAANLESPAQGATLSGLGFISGWKCDAGDITVRINDGGHIPVATGQPRADTRIACGTIHNGFITQMNWALLGDGEHTVVAYDDGVKFASAVFTVMTAGEPYLPDAEGQCVVPDFPAPGENASFAWNTSTQHLELTDVGSHVVAPNPTTTGLERFVGLWETTYRGTYEGCTHHPPFTTTWPFTVNTATEFDTSNGLSIVLPAGYIEGSFPTEPEGERTLSLSGRFTATTGTGTWFNVHGCGGTWTARKISENPNAVPPEPEPDPIHGRCGTTRNTCQAGTPNDSAVADTETHYRWICTGENGGMSSGTCQVAKPAPPDPHAGTKAVLRKLLGTWRVCYGSPNACDEWTFTDDIRTSDDGDLFLSGSFDSLDRIEWVIVFYVTRVSDYVYQAFHVDIIDDEFGYGSCEYLWFNLVAPAQFQGVSYGSAAARDGTCEPIQGRGSPATGQRIRAYQGAALSLQDEASGWVVYGVMDDDLAPLGGAPRE